ncbi:MAG: hypothetical protein QOG69_1305 [Actinomycetota bacterium]|nr:hypothetical protein [Actinomycetota bacterium]
MTVIEQEAVRTDDRPTAPSAPSEPVASARQRRFLSRAAWRLTPRRISSAVRTRSAPRPDCTDFVELKGRKVCGQPAIAVAAFACPHDHTNTGYLCPDHASRIKAAVALRPQAIHCSHCHQQPGRFAHCCVVTVTVTRLEV